jgi:lysozyme family protein
MERVTENIKLFISIFIDKISVSHQIPNQELVNNFKEATEAYKREKHKTIRYTEEYIKTYFQKFGYEVIEFRKGNTSKIKQLVKHLGDCGYQYEVTFNNFKNKKNRCKKCAGLLKVTREQIDECLERNLYRLIQYNGIGSMTKHLIEHLTCGNKYLANYSDFKNGGHRCSKCAGNSKITREDVSEYLEKNGYRLIKYNGTGNKTNHFVRHISCNHKYPVSYHNFKAGNRCPKCTKRLKITKEKISECLEENGYRLVKYNGKGSQTNHLVEHILCGHQYPVNYDSFNNAGHRCSQCCAYSSEKLCRNVFERFFCNKFVKVRPKFLQGLELDGYCQELGIAFEYNGIQHYELGHFHYYTKEELEKIQDNDRRKLEICNRHGIKLCVIPYIYNCHKPRDLEDFIRNWVTSNVGDFSVKT